MLSAGISCRPRVAGDDVSRSDEFLAGKTLVEAGIVCGVPWIAADQVQGAGADHRVIELEVNYRPP